MIDFPDLIYYSSVGNAVQSSPNGLGLMASRHFDFALCA
jgi:hypothetical protein